MAHEFIRSYSTESLKYGLLKVILSLYNTSDDTKIGKQSIYKQNPKQIYPTTFSNESKFQNFKVYVADAWLLLGNRQNLIIARKKASTVFPRETGGFKLQQRQTNLNCQIYSWRLEDKFRFSLCQRIL